MAEPLSIAASIAGIISLADVVFRYTFKFGRAVYGANDDVERLSEEINSFSAVLRSLHALAHHLETQGQEFDCALRVEHLSQCERTFEKIKKRLKKAGDDLNGHSKLRAVTRQLKWPYSASETKELLADVSRHKSTISLATSADTMRQLQLLLSKQSDRQGKIERALEKSSQKIEIGTNILLNSQKKSILDFFMHPSLNPQQNLEQSIKWRQPTTGTWLLESEEIKEWFATPGSRLWLKGIPGGGKTVLAGAVIQEALTRVSADPSTLGVAFFFCDYKDENTHSPVNILGSIAHQLALQKDEAFEQLEEYYQELHPQRSLTQSPDADELRATVRRMCEKFNHVFIVVDGVDECQEEAEEVATTLQELAECTDNSSIAIFSRDEEEIQMALDDEFRNIAISARTEDIETYIRAEMMLRESHGRLVVKDVTVKERIEAELVQRANGMFRWVACQLDYMSELWTDADRLEALNHLPETLHDSYFRILKRINKLPAKTRDMIQLCLRLLAFFPQPLTVQELSQAVSTPKALGAQLDQIVDQESISRKCSSLIRKSADDRYFEFAHFTVQEFLSDAALSSLPEFASYMISKRVDEPALGLLCLRFIQLKNFESKPSHKLQDEQLSFYSAAATRWPQLTARGLESPELLQAGRSLFRPTENQIFSGWISMFTNVLSREMSSEPDDHDSERHPWFTKPARPLHVAAALNLPEICSFLIHKGSNVNTPYTLGTPLELSQSSFFRLYDRYGSGSSPEEYTNECRWLERTLPCPERRNKTFDCLLRAGAKIETTAGNLFLHSMIVSWRSRDFCPTIGLLSGGLVPAELEIDRFQVYLDQWWKSERSDPRLHGSLEVFNDYLVDSAVLDTDWGFKLGKLIWYSAVAMSLPFTKDPSRTNSRIAFSPASLRTQVNFAIADDNSNFLTVCLDDGRISISEVGCWSRYPSEMLLHNAIRRQAVNCATLLLGRGCDPGAKNSEGQDAVILSGIMESGALLDILVQHGVSLLSVDTEGQNIWHLAAMSLFHTSREYLDVLFSTRFPDTGKGLTMRTYDDSTPFGCVLEFHEPTSNKEEDCLLEFMSRCNNVPCFWDSQGPVFPRAFEFKSPRIIQLLLTFGLDPQESGLTITEPLHDLDAHSSVDWVRLLSSVFPQGNQSRCKGRLPIERYVDLCLRDGIVPSQEILSELTFDGLFENSDRRGWAPWTFLCCSDIRHGRCIMQRSWHAFQVALHHFISHGCLQVHENVNHECGLYPLFWTFHRLRASRSLPVSLLDGELLCKAISVSKYWDPRSDPLGEFLRAAIDAADVGVVRTLVHNSVALHDLVFKAKAIRYACTGRVAIGLCSTREGQEIFKLILNTGPSTHQDKLLTAMSKDGLIHGLEHPGWVETEARWILEQLVEKGADIDAVNEGTSSASKTTPLVWHLIRRSTVMSEVLLDMGAKLDGPRPDERQSWKLVKECTESGNVAFLKKMLQASKLNAVPIRWATLFETPMRLGQKSWLERMNGFQYACFKGHRECVNFFLEDIGVDNQLTSENGYTALHFAAVGEDEATIKKLVLHGFDILAESHNKQTPLHWAVVQKSADAVRTLINFGARNSSDTSSMTPLDLAEADGTVQIIEMLEAGFPEHCIERDGSTTSIALLLELKSAIANGSLSHCQRLFSQGCPLEIPIPRTGNAPPLAYSLDRCQIEIAEWLLEQGAPVLDIYTFAAPRINAMMTSAFYPALDRLLPTMLRQFTKQGGNWDDLAAPLITYAATHGNGRGLEAILSHLHSHPSTSLPLAELVTQARYGVSAVKPLLHQIIHEGKDGIASLLLENGASVDCVDSYGYTPLDLATTPESVELLLAYDASPTPVLTRCLFESLDLWEQDASRVLRDLVRTVQQQSGFPSLNWLDSSPPVYYDTLAEETLHGHYRLPKLSKYHDEVLKGEFNHLASLPSVSALRLLFQSGMRLSDVEPFPWHLHNGTAFSQMTFLGKLYRLVCHRFGYSHVKGWANLEPVEGWSPLCRAASQNCTKKMENCLSLGAEINFEGCPLGSALMIASACGQLEAVKLLVRRGARFCYDGRVGKLSVFGVTRSKFVKAWLLVGRFNDQRRIKHTAEHDKMTETRPWSGLVQARANLHGYQLVRDDEARIGCAKRLSKYGRAMRGRVAPYIGGLVFNRHEPSICSAFATVE